MNPHTLRILIWFVISAAGCLFFWLAYKGELNRAYILLMQANERYNAAGGQKHTLDLAIGFERDVSPELLEAKEHLKKCEINLESAHRQRTMCLIATPFIIAIIILFAL